MNGVDMPSHIQDGGHHVISRRKVLALLSVLAYAVASAGCPLATILFCSQFLIHSKFVLVTAQWRTLRRKIGCLRIVS